MPAKPVSNPAPMPTAPVANGPGVVAARIGSITAAKADSATRAITRRAMGGGVAVRAISPGAVASITSPAMIQADRSA